MNPELFLTRIACPELRAIKNLVIPLNQQRRQHLILTGKNGSGKTTFLTKINDFLDGIVSGNHNGWALQPHVTNVYPQDTPAYLLPNDAKQGSSTSSRRFGPIDFYSSLDHALEHASRSGDFLVAFFDAKRTSVLSVPNGIEKVSLQTKYQSKDRASTAFIQYIVNLKAERSFARDDGDQQTADKIDLWFSNLENRLGDILDVPDLRLEFDRRNYDFKIVSGENDAYSLTELSDGYSAILSIVTELILRMEAKEPGSFNMQGIVLIDEIETHLHVDLQKKILPFLIDFFPRLQFIVTTHSPFVLSSIENAVICDLQKQIVTHDLSGYSYDTLIESYFSSDKYSQILQKKVAEFEFLASTPAGRNTDTYRELEKYFAALPKYFATELQVKLQQIALSHIGS